MLLISATPALEHSLSIEDNLEDLRIFVRNRAASFLAPSRWSEAICSLSTVLLASTWSPNCYQHQIPVLSEQPEILQSNSSHISAALPSTTLS